MISWDEISVPTELPEVIDEITYQRVVMNSGSTWDYFPGHFDPAYAENQGHPAIFVNTMHLAGFADRIATDWAGPRSRVVRRKMRLAGSIYAGDTMVGRGRVVAKHCDTTVDPPRRLLGELLLLEQPDERRLVEMLTEPATFPQMRD